MMDTYYYVVCPYAPAKYSGCDVILDIFHKYFNVTKLLGLYGLTYDDLYKCCDWHKAISEIRTSIVSYNFEEPHEYSGMYMHPMLIHSVISYIKSRGRIPDSTRADETLTKEWLMELKLEDLRKRRENVKVSDHHDKESLIVALDFDILSLEIDLGIFRNDIVLKERGLYSDITESEMELEYY
jgi:hypothetical protein